MTGKQAAKRFSRLLDELWQRRTRDLRRKVTGPGKVPSKKFSTGIRDKQVEKMLDAAYDALVRRLAKKEFNWVVADSHQRHLKGSIRDRFDRVWSLVKTRLKGPIVYAFWRGDKCLYVGKGKSPKRLRSYRMSVQLREADLLEVWEVPYLSELSRAECLAVHLFEPAHNENMPAQEKRARKCPICRELVKIENELWSLFRMKG